MESKKFIIFIIKIMWIMLLLTTFRATQSYAANKQTSISRAKVTISNYSYVYDGQQKKPTVTSIKLSNTTIPSSGYTISYKDNINAGKGWIILDGKGNYSGRVSVSFKIEKKDISKAQATLNATTYTYDGTAKKPGITIKIDKRKLTLDKDYKISYSNNTNSGTATATIKGYGNYSGSFKKTFKINKRTITSKEVSLSQTKYTYKANTTFKPGVTVLVNKKRLSYNSNYTVTYSNNTSAGTAKVMIVGKGNYTGTVTKTFQISKVDLKNVTRLASYNHTYNGQAKTPSATFSIDSIKEGRDYTITYSNNINAGTATAKIVGKGNYTGNFTIKYKIDPIKISNAKYTLNQTKYVYNGKKQEPSPIIKLNNVTLKVDKDYKIEYSNNTDAGTAHIKITGQGNYTGSIDRVFTITKKDISNLSSKYSLSATIYSYDGTAKTPGLTININNKYLRKDIDYTINYKNNVYPGTATVIIEGIGNYTGSFKKSFVINKKKISKSSVKIEKEQYEYTGQQIKPKVTVTVNSKTLKNNTDYTVSYSNNTNPGKATLKVEGKGNYTGTINNNFMIVKRNIANLKIELSKDEYVYDGKSKKPSVTIIDGTKTLKLNTDYIVSYSNNTNVGQAKVSISGQGNYTGSYTKAFFILSKQQNSNSKIGNTLYDEYTDNSYSEFNSNSGYKYLQVRSSSKEILTQMVNQMKWDQYCASNPGLVNTQIEGVINKVEGEDEVYYFSLSNFYFEYMIKQQSNFTQFSFNGELGDISELPDFSDWKNVNRLNFVNCNIDDLTGFDIAYNNKYLEKIKVIDFGNSTVYNKNDVLFNSGITLEHLNKVPVTKFYNYSLKESADFCWKQIVNGYMRY